MIPAMDLLIGIAIGLVIGLEYGNYLLKKVEKMLKDDGIIS